MEKIEKNELIKWPPGDVFSSCLVIVFPASLSPCRQNGSHKETKERTEGATGLGRITREQVEGWTVEDHPAETTLLR